MAIKLDDFLSKKKEPAQVLDLSRIRISTKEEFRKYFDKIPEYKIKPEKVMPESIKIRDKDFTFTAGRREGRVTDYNYLDPTPPDMKGVNLADLCPVSIDWKMLTTLRPKTKVEEDMFSRLVQLGKLDLKRQQQLKRAKDTDWIRRTKKPRSSIVETRVISCKECGEDFCNGSQCCKLMYENFFRIQPTITTGVVKDLAAIEGADDTEKKPKKKRRGRKRKRSARPRKLRKNSIFNRPASRGCNRDHSKCTAPLVVESRSTSQDRARPRSRRGSMSPGAPRARSAPRIHFKGIDSEEECAAKKTGFTSESAEYSTPSHSDSESPLRRVGFADVDGSSLSTRRFIRSCTLSEYGECSETHRRNYRPYTAGDWRFRDHGDTTTTDNSDSSPSPGRFRRLQPSTIKLEFDPDATTSLNIRLSPKPLRSRSAVRRARQRREVQKISQGLSKIEIGFTDDQPLDYPPIRHRRRSRPHKSAAARPSPSFPELKPSEEIIRGTSIFTKASSLEN